MLWNVENEYQARWVSGVRKRGGDVGRQIMQNREDFIMKNYNFRAFGLKHCGNEYFSGMS